MSMVHASAGLNTPAGPQLKSEVAIVCGMARAALKKSKIPWDDFENDYSLIRERIEKTVPGFEAYNERIKNPGGFYLGNSAAERRWNTAGKKAKFFAHSLPKSARNVPENAFLLTTFRSHDQYNTTIYALNDRYRGVKGARRVIFMNPKDMKRLGLREGQGVDVKNSAKAMDSLKNFKIVPYDIPEGNLGAYFPEANALVAIDAFDKRAKTPASKSIPVLIEKAR